MGNYIRGTKVADKDSSNPDPHSSTPEITLAPQNKNSPKVAPKKDYPTCLPTIVIERTPTVAKTETTVGTSLMDIHKDEEKYLKVTPKKSKLAGSSGSRTPLLCMKNKTAAIKKTKSENTLYDTKDNAKIEKILLQVPTLMGQHKDGRASLNNIYKYTAKSGDCENMFPK